MSIKACPECKNDVSTSAASCPHCGFSVAGEQTLDYFEMRAKLLIKISVFLFGLGIICAILCLASPDLVALSIGMILIGVLGYVGGHVKLNHINKSRNRKS